MSSESEQSASSSLDRRARMESIMKSIKETRNISQINQDSREHSADRSTKYRAQQTFSRSIRGN